MKTIRKLVPNTTRIWGFRLMRRWGTMSSSMEFSPIRSKVAGCFIGAAIGDAMGGPVECQHFRRISKLFPDFENFLPYRKPPGLISVGPGYALSNAPGCVTDDTFIRMDLTDFLLHNAPPYTSDRFAEWLLRHADFSNWWPVAVEPLRRVEKGEVAAGESGLTHRQGGGGGWWQPVAILAHGQPAMAAAITAEFCRIWKAPFEQNMLSAVVAGQAEALRPAATVDSVVATILDFSGPLARRLFSRAVEIASKAKTSIF